MRTAAYDPVAEWYEHEFAGGRAPDADVSGGDPIGVDRALRDLLGPGTGTCLEIGCGTGLHSARIRALGWTPVGTDLSAGMLRHARARVPVARADAARLPVRDASVDAATAVLVHTDMPRYPDVLREVARVLRPGYRETYWSTDSWTSSGVRDKVGATHRAVPELLHAFLDAGLVLERFAEGGGAVPTTLSARARRPAR